MNKQHKYDCLNCGAIFTYDQVKIIKCDYGGVALQKKVCPHCLSEMWSSYDDREVLNRYLLLSEYNKGGEIV